MTSPDMSMAALLKAPLTFERTAVNAVRCVCTLDGVHERWLAHGWFAVSRFESAFLASSICRYTERALTGCALIPGVASVAFTKQTPSPLSKHCPFSASYALSQYRQ